MQGGTVHRGDSPATAPAWQYQPALSSALAYHEIVTYPSATVVSAAPLLDASASVVTALIGSPELPLELPPVLVEAALVPTESVPSGGEKQPTLAEGQRERKGTALEDDHRPRGYH